MPNRLIYKDTSAAGSRRVFPSSLAKKTFYIGAVLGGASFALFFPVLASASFLSSLIQKTAPQSSAHQTAFNSQTMPLLSPATNINPSPSVGGGSIVLAGGVALVAQEGPSGTAADIENRPTVSQISAYTVHEGDTLASIADLFGVSVNTVVWANDLKNNPIRPGQTLIILPITGIQHTILKGESLASLAREYHSNAHDIAQYNDLPDNASLLPGTVVIIPDGEMSLPKVQQKPDPKVARLAQVKKLSVSNKPTSKLHGADGPLISGYYAWPVASGIITQGLHGFDAVDIGAPKGTNIFAAADGVVLVAKGGGGWNGGYGNYVVIKHANGTQTLYAHATKVLVSPGAQVSQGEVIATVGSTGESTGPHLHFEVRGAQNPFGSVRVGLSQ